MGNSILEIQINEMYGLIRNQEVITQGIPFPEGVIFDSSKLASMDENNMPIPFSVVPHSNWKDGSIKWMLFDFLISMDAYESKIIKICYDNNLIQSDITEYPVLELVEEHDKIIIKTKESVFELDTSDFLRFRQIYLDDIKLLKDHSSCFYVKDRKGEMLHPFIDKWSLESRNQLRIVLLFEGHFAPDKNAHALLQYKCRIHFYPASIVRVDFSLLNQRPARHLGGVWDLGDKGSFLFRCLNFDLAVSGKKSSVNYSVDLSDELNSSIKDIVIYQDSSGGKNWKSNNHVNRKGEVPLSFKGYKVMTYSDIITPLHSHDDSERGLLNEIIKEGNRATPIISLIEGATGIAVTLKQFWQNFPKSVETNKNIIRVGIFPEYFNDLHELQGGEQKTHTIYLLPFCPPLQHNMLKMLHTPLKVNIAPDWFYLSKASPRPIPLDAIISNSIVTDYQNLINMAVKGNLSFENRREIIDEYGWRNFGDIYADHEAVFKKDNEEFISHYNNQYDIIKGAIIQFMRSSDYSWFNLADELAGHISDIDIYHTCEDRFQYNHGLFWHTDHHVDASTSTHRSISKKHMEVKDPRYVGGGPSYEHNYTTGLLYHYWLTGEQRSKESVLELAKYVINGISGPDTIIEFIIGIIKNKFFKASKGVIAPYQGVYGLNGPGRGSGNSLNVLVDVFSLTNDKKYLNYADILIKKCINPNDDINSRNLLDAEKRWMYTIFLQALGKYLDIKYEYNQLDESYFFAKLSLIKYAEWMLENEYPYLEKPELLEFPNETWAAQDIRKADILSHASLYAPCALKNRFKEKSLFFLRTSIKQLQKFENNYLVRPLAILMTNGMISFDVLFGVNSSDSIKRTEDNSLNYVKRNKNSSLIKVFFTYMKRFSLKKELQWIKLRIDSKRIR